MKVDITNKNVANGYVIIVLEGEHKNEYVAQKEGKFTSDLIWAKLFNTKGEAESFCRARSWNFSS